MSRLAAIDPKAATGKAKELLDGVHQMLYCNQVAGTAVDFPRVPLGVA